MKHLTCTLVGLWTLAAALPLAGQQPELTRAAAEQAAAFYNATATSRVSGPTRLAPGTVLEGSLAALGGPLRVAGTVRGDVLVINGDVRLEAGGRITGALTVTGGSVAGDTGVVAGPVTVYEDALRFRQENGRIVALEPAEAALVSQSTWFGRGGFNVVVDGAYNRVEGLPIAFGPRFELGRTNPTIFDARVIYRTGNGIQFHPDEMGHDVWVEQYIGGYRSLRVGLGWHRVTDPVENRGLTDVENSLSTFILHRDLRDHYERSGWRAFFRYTGRTRPLEVGVEYRDEHHSSVAARTPWSLLDNDEPWRLQPQVAEGDIRLIRGWVRWDTRNDLADPSAGWLLDVQVEQGLEGELIRDYWASGPTPPVVRADTANAEFTALRVDLRRYLRVGPRTRIALRALAAGSPDDGALPPQRQHVLGGEGSLPGYAHFAFDCGARGPLQEINGLGAYYGCDRKVLFQAELRFAFLGSSRVSLGRRLGLDFELATAPELVLFADAGRTWIEPESLSQRLHLGPDDFRYDAGVGLRLGRLGFYLAAPLSAGGDGVNFFLRLGPRI